MSGGQVIGFAGASVEGGISVKEPLFERQDGRFAVGDLEGSGHTPSIFSRLERDDLVERGFLTLTSSLKWPARDFGAAPGAMLCVHEHFIRPPTHGSRLEKALVYLKRDDDSGYYLAYAPKHEVVARMREWGSWLLAEAGARLKKSLDANEAEAALEDANRALSLISPVRDEDAVIDAFAICRACHYLLDADPEIVMLDAEVDFRDRATDQPDRFKLNRIRVRAFQYLDGGTSDRLNPEVRSS